ncbi:MAG: hypothetical protein OER96_06405 [Gammaproteobacteria bacterium]|nr:hypothetical protein [Gammaproteobacteria bacterium]
MRQIALSRSELERLPDNYKAQVDRKIAPNEYDSSDRTKAFLPAKLWDPKGPWVLIGEGLDNAITSMHRREFRARSTFHVFLNLPGGRDATPKLASTINNTDLIKGLADKLPELPLGTQVALVRRLNVLAKSGYVHATPITQSVQLRVYRNKSMEIQFDPSRFNSQLYFPQLTDQDVFMFALNRKELSKNAGESLAPAATTFHSSIDRFMENSHSDFGSTIVAQNDTFGALETCSVCHTSGIVNILSLQSVARPLLVGESVPYLSEGNSRQNEYVTVSWKKRDYTWGYLRALWLH